jgi:D-cysteine desulfhydrase/L-cysteate sulfo-lyase
MEKIAIQQAALGRLDALPRAALVLGPTPLEEMPNLASALGGPRLFIKRDDCTGLGFGGNKVRQLEFYLGEALAKGADTVLITGAVQSNFACLAAAAARKLGLDCELQLEERVAKGAPAYRNSGNVLLDRLLGATLHSYPDGEDEAGADRRLEEIAGRLSEQGRRPYVIHLAPGHPPLGALGYVAAARELLAQLAERELSIDEIVVASGSGHSHGGLLFGLRALGSGLRVTGVCVRRDAAVQAARIASRCREIAAYLELDPVVEDRDIHLVDDFLAPGYGRFDQAVLRAIDLAARHEAQFLDPVYTGKAMAALLRRAEAAGPDHSLLFLHTGGTPAIFAYEPDLTAAFAKSGEKSGIR